MIKNLFKNFLIILLFTTGIGGKAFSAEVNFFTIGTGGTAYTYYPVGGHGAVAVFATALRTKLSSELSTLNVNGVASA